MEKKICSRCKKSKPLPDFSKHAGNPDGKQSWCKLCVSKRDKAARAAKMKKKKDAIYYQKNKKTLRAKQNARNKEIRERRLLESTRSFLPPYTTKTGVKLCPKCGTEKEFTDFSKDNSKPDGLQGWCKECQKEAWNRNHNYNPQKKSVPAKKKSVVPAKKEQLVTTSLRTWKFLGITWIRDEKKELR